MRHARHQRGVALITALLIVALATIVSVKISSHLQLDIRRTGNIIGNEQALQYNLLAESYVRNTVLYDDRQDNQIDHLGEDWAADIPPLPVEGGTIGGKLSDLQACINLNTITSSSSGALTEQRLRRLIANQGYYAGAAQAVIDWVDNDLANTNPDGAEDGYYMNLEQPYRSANSAMHSVSELRLVKGFEDNELYRAIAPSLCAIDASTSINVNTAPLEVLRSLGDGISDKDAENIISERTDNPFETIDEFLNFENLRQKILQPENQNQQNQSQQAQNLGLSVSTDYFLLETEANIGQARTVMYTMIRRDDDGKSTVVARSQGAW